MYNDYPTRYESNLNEYLILYIVLFILLIGLTILTVISLAKIFKKANRSGISAFIPIYNFIVLLEITNLPKYYFILLLVPGVNIVFNVVIMTELARLFKKSKKFGLGLAFLPFIFYPLLAFSKSEYIGINLVAKEEKSTVIELPKIVNEEENPVINESFDDKNKNINISIGGGVYQKDYTNNLLNIDEKQIIIDKTVNNNDNIMENIENNNISQSVENSNVIKDNNINENITNNIFNDKSYFESFNTNNIKGNNTNIGQVNNYTPNNNNQLKEKQINEYIVCSQCGAQVKKSAGVCFLCGKKID